MPDDLSVAGRAQVDSIDPDFRLPTAWKVTLGYDAELPWYGMIATAEIMRLRNRDGVFYKAINIGAYNPETGLYDAPTGTLFDGRGSYWCTIGGSTSSSNKNCGNNPGYTASGSGSTLPQPSSNPSR